MLQDNSRKRLYEVIKVYVGLAAAGLAYAFIVSLIGRGMPCIFNLATGLRCPSCGVSRMLLNLMEFDIADAFRFNPVLFVISPVVIYLIIKLSLNYVMDGKMTLNKRDDFLCIALIVILLVWGVIRNIYGI